MQRGDGMAAAEEMLVTVRQGKKKGSSEMKEDDKEEEEEEANPSVDADKLSYEIFSILESKFLFGYEDQKLWLTKEPPLPVSDPGTTAAPAPAPAVTTPSVKTQRGKVRVLCIDGGGGGGMRGVLPGKALAYLEQALRSKSGDPDARISDYFDVAAGTGIGGVFAAMLFATRDGSRPLFHADDTWRFLVDHGELLFRKASSSSSSLSSSPGFFRRVLRGGGGGGTAAATAAMEKVMKEAFGERLTLRDTVKPLLIPCHDLRSSAPFVFSRADALESESFDFRLWEVCRATWAEPGRFEPAEIMSVDRTTVCVGIDGGLAMSNPAAAAITHVLHNKQEFPFVRGVEDLMVLSLGCGASGAATVVPEADQRRLRRWGAKEWTRPVARIAADGAADLVDQAVAMAFGQCRSSNYVRVQPSSMGRCVVDVDSDPSPANVKVLLEVAEEMLKQKNVESVLFSGKRIGEQMNMEKLDRFAGELVLEHQRRSCRIAPTVAFKQAASRST
ncbi:Patatin-like phospholipase [Musa troglodytarum]|uniref:Patatin n=1 Tax=Musa troglodytarum TaxID=320322 RepID=A0A9E7FP23_9LILI|nr:Patatin-like phospholipase [Musa troglodytarum]